MQTVATIRALQHLNSWCTGEDSNLRSSKERQIYSLLPLTARPPVPSHPSDEDLSPGNRPIAPQQQRPVTGTPPLQPSDQALVAGKPYPPALHLKPLQRAYSAHQAPPGKSPACRSMHLSGITAEDRPAAQKFAPGLKLAARSEE